MQHKYAAQAMTSSDGHTGTNPDPSPSPSTGLTKALSQALGEAVADGQVNYALLAKSDQLKAYWNQIANERIERFQSAEETLAFYINAYNALSIQGILRGRSPTTLVGKFRLFYGDKYDIAGKRMNLYHFEHKVIRSLGEPRIHFALVCSATSCPKLRSEAYTAKALEQQLNENAIDFINDPTKNRFDLENKTAYLSKIFGWFTKDFTATGLSLQQYIAQFIADDEVAIMLRESAFTIKYSKYDWRLNGQL